MANYLCNVENDEILNKRIFSRNLAMQAYSPAFDPRPQETKYVRAPTINGDINSNPDQQDLIIWKNSTTFFPNVGKAPWIGYVSSINNETELRNQSNPLSRDPKHAYIPNENSDLYINKYLNAPDKILTNYNTTINKSASKCVLSGNKSFFNNYTRWEIR